MHFKNSSPVKQHFLCEQVFKILEDLPYMHFESLIYSVLCIFVISRVFDILETYLNIMALSYFESLLYLNFYHIQSLCHTSIEPLPHFKLFILYSFVIL